MLILILPWVLYDLPSWQPCNVTFFITHVAYICIHGGRGFCAENALADCLLPHIHRAVRQLLGRTVTILVTTWPGSSIYVPALKPYRAAGGRQEKATLNFNPFCFIPNRRFSCQVLIYCIFFRKIYPCFLAHCVPRVLSYPLSKAYKNVAA